MVFRLSQTNLRARITRAFSTERGLLYVTAGNIGSAALGGLFWFVIAIVLDVQSYGQISYFVAIGAISAAISSLGLGTSLTTFAAKGQRRFAQDTISFVLILGLVSGMLVSLINPILGVFVASLIFFNMNLSNLLGKRRYRQYSWISMGARALQIGLSLALFFVLGVGGILLGYAIAMLIFSFYLFSSLRDFHLQFGVILNHRNFILHSYGTNLLSVSSMYLDKIVIGTIFGFGLLGIYTISSQFLFLFAALPGAVYQYLLPQSSAGFSTLNIKRISLVGASVLSVTGVLASPIIIRTFFPDYADSILVTQVMMLALMPYTFSTITREELFAKERSRIVLQGMFILIVSLIVAQIALGSIIGSVGLAFAVVMAFSFEAIYLWHERARRIRVMPLQPQL